MFDFDKVEQIIQEKVKPKLNENYGDIELLDVNNGVVEIKLSGDSIECPSLKFIIVDLIEKNLKENIPKIKQVVLVNELDEELRETVKEIFKKKDKESCC